MPNKPRGYSPTEKPEAPTRLTIDEFLRVKKMFEDSPLAKWIVLAGIGGLVELIHTLWLAARYVWKF